MRTHLVAAAAALAFAGTSQAALVSSTLNNVTILGNTYDVTFYQDDDGTTTFNEVFGAGGSPSLPFDAGNAFAAAQELLAAVNAADFDVSPGSTTQSGFQLVYSYTANSRSWYSAWRDTPGNPFNGVFGPSDAGRDARNILSIATFAPANAVPVPATLALAGVALAMLGVARRRA